MAEMWLEAGQSELRARRQRTSFELFRQAAELAAKVILLRHQGSYPKTHAVAAPLAKAGLMPATVDGKQLHQFLSRFTLGTYGFDQPLHASDLQDAKRLAMRMVAACRRPA